MPRERLEATALRAPVAPLVRTVPRRVVQAGQGRPVPAVQAARAGSAAPAESAEAVDWGRAPARVDRAALPAVEAAPAARRVAAAARRAAPAATTGGAGGTTGGTGGATGGTGGATGGTGGAGGAGGTAGGGATDAGTGVDGGLGSCPGGTSYCNDFERELTGSMPVGWTRVGGSDGDWQVFFDTSNVFAQNHASSSTFRLCYPSGAAGAPWSGATTVSARVKILAPGSSGTTTAFLCLGYRTGSGGNHACLALEPGAGARIRMNAGASPTDGPLWPAAIAVGSWYDVKIALDATGGLSAYWNGMLLGSYMPPSAIAGGYVAIATQSAQAAFDTVMVTQP